MFMLMYRLKQSDEPTDSWHWLCKGFVRIVYFSKDRDTVICRFSSAA